VAYTKTLSVPDAPDGIVDDLHMMPARSISETIKKAEGIPGNLGATVAAIPDGTAVAVSGRHG
jgi:hypothetical protein